MAKTAKRGRGRPPGKSYVVVKAPLTPAAIELLNMWARKHKTTKAAALREAVDKLLE